MDYSERQKKIKEINSKIYSKSKLANSKRTTLNSLKTSKKSWENDLKNINKVITYLGKARTECSESDSEIKRTKGLLERAIICDGIGNLIYDVAAINSGTSSRIEECTSHSNTIRNTIENEINNLQIKINNLTSEINSITSEISKLNRELSLYGRY